MSKVFLGGTCNNTTWRDELIPLLKIDYFNPVVEDWTTDCIEIENMEKDECCNLHLYVITSAMSGVYSIAEIIESVHRKDKTTILQVVPDGFDEGQLRSLTAVCELVKSHIGLATVDSDIKKAAHLINVLCDKN